MRHNWRASRHEPGHRFFPYDVLLCLIFFGLSSIITLAATSKGSVTLAWDAVTLNTDGDPTTVAYYQVRWGTVSGEHGSGTSAGNVTQFTVKGLDTTQLWYFVVTAVGTNTLESMNSNEVSAQPSLILRQ